jgi:hypothetical protein
MSVLSHLFCVPDHLDPLSSAVPNGRSWAELSAVYTELTA